MSEPTDGTEATTNVILTGYVAIGYADQLGMTLNKYQDPTEGARAGLSVEEARRIASKDPDLIWVLMVRHAARPGQDISAAPVSL